MDHPSDPGGQRLFRHAAQPRVGIEEEHENATRVVYAFTVTPTVTHNHARIAYSLVRAQDATISVYDVTGRLVDKLVHGFHESGVHEVQWSPHS